MNIATLAPYLITYLCGCATPILIVFKTADDRENGSGCLYLLLLIGLFIAICGVAYLWMTAPNSSLG
jgi:hypothetical protein